MNGENTKQEQLVSIIVPIYNVEKYLSRCLESIRLQSYSNIEVVMVDDGSKDLSGDIAREYEIKDARFCLYSKENGGLSSGRNYGLKYARGEYVCFVDSDDFIGENYVKELVNAFDSKTDIVISDYAIFNVKNHKTYLHTNMLKEEIFDSIEDKKRLISYLLTGRYQVMPVWKNMYKTRFLKENNIIFVSERLVYAEDQLFHVEAYTRANRVKIIPVVEFFHIIVPGSLSQSYRDNYFEMQKTLFNSIIKILENSYSKEFVENYMKQFPSVIGSSIFCLCKCDFKQAISNVRKILNDDMVIECYNGKSIRTGVRRYWILYKLGKYNNPILVVLVVKLMLFSNPIYRFFQRKKNIRFRR